MTSNAKLRIQVKQQVPREKMTSVVLWILMSISMQIVSGYPTFQTKIPNGLNVPNPCQRDDAWPGVGHKNPAGSGERNPFGLDFANSGFNWTSVCVLDSDGDGKTNGEELGDAGCTWKEGDPSQAIADVTHPGVCEPLTSPTCIHKNSWLTCSSKFDCPAVNEPDVRRLPLHIPPTPVPPKETTYTCYAFALPNDTDYHVIAVTPIINTTNTKSLVHHMILYMCDNWRGDDTLFKNPRECFMGIAGCSSIVGLWGIGLTGQCHMDAYGFRMGGTGFKYAVVEIHWNNPTLAENYVDSSGLMVYYTPKLRPNDGLTLMSGQTSLEIPPRVSSITYQSKCGEYCTSPLTHPLSISWVTLHMHGLGKSGQVELYRNGSRVAVLLNVESFDYDSPPEVMYKDPQIFRPGDELRVTCVFSSLNRNTTTRFGVGTNDEMCYAFLTYFPAAPKFSSCDQHRTVEICSTVGYRCDSQNFFTLSKNASSVCTTSPECSPSCRALMEAVLETRCLHGDFGLFFAEFFPNVKQLFAMIEQCGLSQNVGGTTTAASVENAAAKCRSTSWIVTAMFLLSLASFF